MVSFDPKSYIVVGVKSDGRHSKTVTVAYFYLPKITHIDPR